MIVEGLFHYMNDFIHAFKLLITEAPENLRPKRVFSFIRKIVIKLFVLKYITGYYTI